MRFTGLVLSGFIALSAYAQAPQSREPGAPFVPHPVASSVNGGHQLLATDINRDGKQDLIALGTQMTQLVWFENPYWQRRSMMHGVVGPHSMTASDLDNDGSPEITLAYGFTQQRPDTPGAIAYLLPFGDPRGIWMLKHVSRIEKDRRLVWAKIDGEPALVDAPLIADYSRLFADSADWSLRINLYRPIVLRQQTTTLQGRDVIRETLISNSGDLIKGRIQNQQFFATTVDSKLMIYRRTPEGRWQSTEIDNSLPGGRTLLSVDINADGRDEIVASGTTPTRRIYVYRSTDDAANTWQRTLLDETMGAVSCVSAELSGDAKPDIACIDGTNPFGIHWYENFAD